MSRVVSYVSSLMGRPLWAPLGYYGSILEPVYLVPEARRPDAGELAVPPLARA